MILKDILQAHFRANPDYELVLFDRLPDEYREQLAALKEDADFYGVLWPHAPGLALKAVNQETALLFLTLQQPGLIPSYVRASFGELCNQAVAELVLDGILEAALQTDGVFISGAAAAPILHPSRASSPAEGKIARLSWAALQYGQALKLESSAELSAWLYSYNAIPASPTWRKLLPTPDAVPVFLGMDAAGQNRSVLDRWYISQPPPKDNTGWRAWNLRRKLNAARAWRPNYKLYISPLPEALPGIIGAVVNELGAAGAVSFKVGRDLYGLLRPDKIVVYCANFDELSAVAARLRQALAGCPAQGVPFTAGIDPDGLLSWGSDPPKESREFAGLESESWRQWVTNRLAVTLLAGKARAAEIAPWQFALERLRLDGVDTQTWAPQQAIWQGERSIN